MSSCGSSSSSSFSIENLLQQPLAFSSSSSEENTTSLIVAASSRIVVETSDGAILNVEVFEDADAADAASRHDGDEVLLFVIPGICESAETKGIQAIVQEAAARSTKVKVAVLELEGHGLSSGSKCLCPSFDRLVGHVVETVQFVSNKLFEKSQSSSKEVSIYLTGNSLGGAVIIYAAQRLYHKNIKGIAPIAPAVGMNPQMLPPTILVYGLKILAYLTPNLQLSLTPYEDPSSYNCPHDTKRNFKGNWPLATSKMLLDTTANTIPNDIQAQKLLTLSNIPSVLVIAGESDHVVPLEAIESFYDTIQSPNKDILKVKKAGHDLMFRTKSSQQITKALLDWIDKREGTGRAE